MNKRKQAKRKAEKKAKEEKESATNSSSNNSSNSTGSSGSRTDGGSAASSAASAASAASATLKEQGSKAFQEKNYDEAIRLFTEAIAVDGSNPVLYSNRSACYSASLQFTLALKDAEEAISLSPSWSKGFLRRGQALEGLMQLQRAFDAYREGAARDESDLVIRRSLEELCALMDEMKLSRAEAALSVNPEEDRFEAMVSWLRDGQAQFPFLYLQYYDSDYRGVHALTKVPNNRIILEVPLSHIMTSDVAKQSDVGQKIIKSGCELNSTHSYLASYLLQERHNPNSFWKPYIRILPQHYRNMPIFFDGSDLDLLRGSFSLRKIIDRQEELKDEFENICRHVPEFRQYGLDEFVWARLVVITRIFGLVVNGNKTDGLVPMADMLNHKRPRETSWTFDDARGSFTITSLKPMARGEQIFDSYGRKCNSRFFVNYGFSLEDNEDNQIAVYLGLPRDDPHYAMKCRYLGGPRAGAQLQRFQIPIDYKEKATKEAFSFLRFAHAKDSELLLLSSEEKELNVKDIAPLSIRNELSVVKHLARICAACLREFDSTVEEDERLLREEGGRKLSMNERNAVLMRKGEKEVGLYYVELEKEVDKLVGMPWKDFKRACLAAADSQILTAQGFRSLHQVLQHFDQHRVLDVACYDADSQSLQYEAITSSQLVYQAEGGKGQLMADRLLRFHGQSGVDLLVTADHAMYVQQADDQQLQQQQQQCHLSPVVVKAEELLRRACHSSPRRRWNSVGFVSSAAHGVDRAELDLSSDFARQLQLSTQDELDAAVELCGCFVVHGSLNLSVQAVQFSCRERRDWDKLLQLFARLSRVLPVSDTRLHARRHSESPTGNPLKAAAGVCCVYVQPEEQLGLSGVRCFQILHPAWWSYWTTQHEAAAGASEDTDDTADSALCCMWRQLAARQCRLYLNGVRSAVDEAEGRQGDVIFTSSLRLRDELQLAAIHAGCSSSFSRCTKSGVITAYQHRQSAVVRSRGDEPDVEEMDDYAPIISSVAGWAVHITESQQQQQQQRSMARHPQQPHCAGSRHELISQQHCPCSRDARCRRGEHRASCCSISCLPRVSLQGVEDSSREGSSLQAPAAVWCVELRHRDHLLIARRVTERDDAGRVLAASLPVVVGNCFPEADTRVLTNWGLLFLEQIEGLEKALQRAGQELLFGCYDERSKTLLYRKGKVVLERPPPYLVDFTSDGEAARWAGSGDYETEAKREDDCHVSLRVTPDHDMYVQLGSAKVQGHVHCSSTQGEPKPHRKMRAQDLLPEQCRCPPAKEGKLDCAHRRAHVRMLACAEEGYAPQATRKRQAVLRKLHLDDAQFPAFLELLGFWLGDGSLEYRRSGGDYDAVAFRQTKETDLDWLKGTAFPQVGLRPSQWRSCDNGDVDSLLITDKDWFSFFDKEFGRKYRGSRYYRAAAATPPSTTRPLRSSSSSSASASSASTRLSVSSFSSRTARTGEDGIELMPTEATACRTRSTCSVDHDGIGVGLFADRFIEHEVVSCRGCGCDSYEAVCDLCIDLGHAIEDAIRADEDDDEKKERLPAEDDSDEEELELPPPGVSPLGWGITWGPKVQPDAVKSVKHLPAWTLQMLSRDEMRLLIAGLHRADGSFTAGDNVIYTSSARFRDQLMQALLHCGYSAYAGLVHREGGIRGHKFHDQSKSGSCATFPTADVDVLPLEKQDKYQPIKATVDVWKVSWAELKHGSCHPAARSCLPSLSRQKGVKRVPYDAERDGRTWCVEVEHGDHLIIAQRAQRGPDGITVTQQSRPIVAGNCSKAYSGRGKFDAYITSVLMPLLKGEH